MPFKFENKITAIREISGAFCDVCGEDISLAVDVTLPTDALSITFSGGYNMFFDDPDQLALLCKSCATELMARYPKFEALLFGEL